MKNPKKNPKIHKNPKKSKNKKESQIQKKIQSTKYFLYKPSRCHGFGEYEPILWMQSHFLRQRGKGENFKCSILTMLPKIFRSNIYFTLFAFILLPPKRVIPHIEYLTNDNRHKDAHPNSQPMGTDVIHCQEKERRAERSL